MTDSTPDNTPSPTPPPVSAPTPPTASATPLPRAPERRAPAPAPIKDRRSRAVGWQSGDALRVTAVVAGLYIVLRLIWFASPLFLTAFLGILFGLAVSSGVDRLERFRIPRGIGAALIVITCLGLLVGFGAWVAPILKTQGAELRHKLPESIDRVERWADKHPGGLVGLIFRGLDPAPPPDTSAAARPDSAPPVTGVVSGAVAGAVAGAVTGAVAGFDSAAVRTPTPTAAMDTTQGSLRDRLGKQFGRMSRYAFPVVSGTLAALGGFLLVIVMAIYIASEPELYRRGMMSLFVHEHRERAGEVLSAVATVLRKWLVTQLIAMTVIGVVTTIALVILNVKAAIALGVLAGLLEFVPTVGPIMSAIPAIAMAFLDSPEKAATVAVVCFFIQFLENHLLIPLLMKGGVNVPPALTVLSQALMAMLFGFLGLMCAVPFLAALMVTVQMLYVEDVVGDQIFDDDDDDPEQG
jgi:predicted PurR-regulated permease PerM